MINSNEMIKKKGGGVSEREACSRQRQQRVHWAAPTFHARDTILCFQSSEYYNTSSHKWMKTNTGLVYTVIPSNADLSRLLGLNISLRPGASL